MVGRSRQPDIFALPRSGLNAFLFAEIAPEANGHMVTVLSMLARQGLDGWEEAARLARLPNWTVLDELTGRLSLLPLPPETARMQAVRLAALLPGHGGKMPSVAAPSAPDGVAWGPLAMLYCVLAMGMVLNVMYLPSQAAAPPATVCAAESPPACANARPQAVRSAGMLGWSPALAGTP